jgi:lipoprotein NlpI/transglutaminase-like putative cysteine protease
MRRTLLAPKAWAAAWAIFCIHATVSAQAPALEAPGSSPIREVQVAADAFSIGAPIPAWVEQIAIPSPTPPRPREPVVIRLFDTQLYAGAAPAYFVHKATRVNEPGALGEIGQITIPFVPQYQRLQLHSIQIIRAGESLDRTKTSAVRFLQRETGLEQGIYSGVVTASVVVSDVRVDDTLEVRYSVYGQNPVFGGKYAQDASWDQAYRIEYRSVILRHPTSQKINWKFMGDDLSRPSPPTESVEAGVRRLHFDGHDSPGIHPDNDLPRGYQPFRWLQFSEYANWAEVATWAQELFRAPTPASPEIREIAQKLKTLPSAEDQVSAALEFTQANIRYFAVLLGESSHRPTAPNVVLKRRYGDCKDKSLFLISLLGELGVEGRPVLVRLNSGNEVDRFLPSPNVFDHVIVQISLGGRAYFLDPTRSGQHGHLARMGQIHEGSRVLVVGAASDALTTIVTPNLADLVRNERFEIATLRKLATEGELEVRQTWNGVGAEVLRSIYSRLTSDQVAKWLTAEVDRRYPGAELQPDPQIQDDPVENTFTVRANYKLPKLAENRDGTWVVRYTPSNFTNTFAPTPANSRTTPIIVPSFPSERKYTFEAHFPDEVSAIQDPKITSIKNRYFAFEYASSFRGNVARVSMTIAPLTDSIDARGIPGFREDVRRVAAAYSGFVLVTKQDVKSPGFLGLRRKDFAQTVLDRLQDTVRKTTETIDSGKLSGSDLADAYCDRASALVDLDKTDRAIGDINKAVSLAPNSSAVMSCFGEIEFAVGEFQKSVTAYSKALSLGSTDASTFQRRGISKFYLGAFPEAADDFAKATEAGTGASQLYSELWLTWTDKRLGRPLLAMLSQHAAAEPRGAWPRPALAMLNGLLTPEEMLAVLDQLKGDEHEFALTEAYFYLGQHYLALGDKSKARDYFEKTRKQRVLFYVEHTAARFELDRLK